MLTTLTAKLTVKAKDDAKKWVEFECEVTNQDGKVVIMGESQVIAPTEKIRRNANKVEDLLLTQEFSL